MPIDRRGTVVGASRNRFLEPAPPTLGAGIETHETAWVGAT